MLLQRRLPGRVRDPGVVQLRRSGHESRSGPNPDLQNPHSAGRNPNLGEMSPEDGEKCHSR